MYEVQGYPVDLKFSDNLYIQNQWTEIQECSGTLKKIQEYSGIFKKIKEFTRLYRNI